MTADPASALVGTWHAGLEEYDFILSVEFCPDGTGRLSYGAGQAMKYEEEFAYSLTWPGGLCLELRDGDEIVDVGFAIEAGPHAVRVYSPRPPRYGQAAWRLRFAADPFPPGLYGGTAFLDFYRFGPGGTHGV